MPKLCISDGKISILASIVSFSWFENTQTLPMMWSPRIWKIWSKRCSEFGSVVLSMRRNIMGVIVLIKSGLKSSCKLVYAFDNAYRESKVKLSPSPRIIM